jgi:hypothetical protein
MRYKPRKVPTVPEAFVFTGKGFRCQLKIYDISACPHGTRPRRVSFRVQTLPDTANRATAYLAAGRQKYHGNDFGQAWQAVVCAVGVVPMPDKLRVWSQFLPKEQV